MLISNHSILSSHICIHKRFNEMDMTKMTIWIITSKFKPLVYKHVKTFLLCQIDKEKHHFNLQEIYQINVCHYPKMGFLQWQTLS